MVSRPWPFTLRVTLISLAVSLAGGVLAAALTVGSLSEYASALGELVSPLRLTAPRPADEADVPFARLQDKALSATARLSFAVPGADGIDPAAADGRGVVLTSDGWIVTAFVRAPVKAVLVGRRVYTVERSVVDAATGMLFLKTTARNLPAVTFGDSTAVRPGQTLYVAQGDAAVQRTSFVASLRSAAASADRPARRFSLLEYVGSDGAGIFDAQGNLLAVSGADGVVPLHLVLSAFRSVVKEGTVVRAFLGASFLDLSVAAGVPSVRTNGREAGALLVSVGKGMAAEAAGLRVGDIVTAVDGRALGAFYGLDDAVGSAVPDQELSLSVDREGTATDLRARLR